MRMSSRLAAALAGVAATLTGHPAAARPMHCIVAGGTQTVDSASIGIRRFEGDIDPQSLAAATPAQWTLGGDFTMFRSLSAHAVDRGRFTLIDLVLGGDPFLELVVDRQAPRAWIRGYVFPYGRVRVREWRAACEPAPPDEALPPPPPSIVADGSPAPPQRRPLPPPSPSERRLMGPRAPAEIVSLPASPEPAPHG